MPKPFEPKKPENEGFFDKLVQRSTGLPDTADQGNQDRSKASKGSEEKTLWKFAGLGLQFAITVSLFAYLGYELDRRLGWSPWGLIGLTMVATIGNLYLLIKDAIVKDADSPKRPPAKK